VALILRPRSIGLFGLRHLAVMVGIITRLGAVAFCTLIAVIHNLMFLGHFSFAYDASEFTAPPPWGRLVIFVPVIGSAVVTFLVTNFAPEAKGHRVPAVMDAIFDRQGSIRRHWSNRWPRPRGTAPFHPQGAARQHAPGTEPRT
jgi:chloride channel protein, CIC family